MRVYIYPEADTYFNLKTEKDAGDMLLKQVEVDDETYMIYKGLILQYERLQQKLYDKWIGV